MTSYGSREIFGLCHRVPNVIILFRLRVSIILQSLIIDEILSRYWKRVRLFFYIILFVVQLK